MRTRADRHRRSAVTVFVGVLFSLVVLAAIAIWLWFPRRAGPRRPALPRSAPPVQAQDASKAAPSVVPMRASREVTLFFQVDDLPYLGAETREVTFLDAHDLAVQLVQMLINGPETESLRPTIPPETQVTHVLLDTSHRWILVDFSSALQTNHPGNSLAEALTVYSIVNTLLYNLPDYRKVWILIDHETRPVLKYHLALDAPLSWNAAWIRADERQALMRGVANHGTH